MSNMPRVQAVVMPLLRDHFGNTVDVVSWVKDVDVRTYPILNVRRLSGLPVDIRLLDRAVIELTAYGEQQFGLAETEQLLLDAQEVLWDAVTYQTPIPGVGYLHSYFQTMGPTQFDSPYDDTFRVQSLIQLGLRPL